MRDTGSSEPEEIVGRNVRRLRVDAGMSQEQLARYMTEHGFSWKQTTVSATEGARRPLRFNEVAALAQLFSVDLNDLAVDELRGGDLAGTVPMIQSYLEELRAHIRDDESALAEVDDQLHELVIEKARLEGRLRAQRSQQRNYEEYILRALDPTKGAGGEGGEPGEEG